MHFHDYRGAGLAADPAARRRLDGRARGCSDVRAYRTGLTRTSCFLRDVRLVLLYLSLAWAADAYFTIWSVIYWPLQPSELTSRAARFGEPGDVNVRNYWPTRSLIRNLTEAARCPRPISKLRAAYVVHAGSAFAVIPAR